MDQPPTPSDAYLAAPYPPGAEPEGSRPAPARRRSTAGWWVGLGVLCYLLFGMQMARMAGDEALPDPAHYSSVELKIMGRYLMGAKALAREWPTFGGETAKDSLDQATTEITKRAESNVIDRMRAAPVLAELDAAERARDQLDLAQAELEAELPEGGDELLTDVALFRRAFAAAPKEPTETAADNAESVETESSIRTSDTAAAIVEEAAPLTDAERQRLIDRHGWFGELAIAQGAAPGDPLRDKLERQSYRLMFSIVVMGGIAVLAFIAGFVLFIVAVAMGAAGRLRSRYAASVAGVPRSRSFVQTVTLFLGLFVGVQIVLALVGVFVDLEPIAHPLTLGVMWVVALVALWPLTRGITFTQLRRAYGWHANGRGVVGVFREIGCGFLGYLAGLPIMLAGILLTVALMAVTSTKSTHPIQNQVEIKSALDAVWLYLLAAVWAPLVEESIFRGALFHQLRSFAGFLPSALATAFVFAIIHPQGYAGVPVLMALAVTFALMREWRGSIIAPMVGHAINNGFVITTMVLILA